MIDIETDVYNLVYDTVIAEYPDAFISDKYVRVPQSFPYVAVEETDNNISTRRIDSSGTEKAAYIFYEINVYHNGITDAKSICKIISQLIDTAMNFHGFTRTLMRPTPNIDDSTIYRVTMRYAAEVTTDKTIYRR